MGEVAGVAGVGDEDVESEKVDGLVVSEHDFCAQREERLHAAMCRLASDMDRNPAKGFVLIAYVLETYTQDGRSSATCNTIQGAAPCGKHRVSGRLLYQQGRPLDHGLAKPCSLM